MLTRLHVHGALLASAWTLLGACGDATGGAGDLPTADGGAPSDGNVAPAGSLVFSAPSIELLLGEERDIAVRYVGPDGAPVAGAAVQLGLLGEAHDSSLDARCLEDGESVPCLAPLTDASGTAAATVRAGDVPAVFRIQARVSDLPPATLDVAVSDAGVGSLSVVLPYVGTRDLGSRTVRLFASSPCGEDWTDLLARTPDLSRTVGPMLDRVEFAALPDSRRYTLLAIAQGPVRPGGAPRRTIGLGCQDAVQVVADGRREITLPVSDLAMVVDGDYQAGLLVIGSAHPPRVGEAVIATAQEAAAAAGDQATLVLDRLEDALDAAEAVAALEALDDERSGPGVTALQSRLDGQGPVEGAEWLAQTLEDALGTLSVSARLRIALAEAVPLRWTVERLHAGVAPGVIEIETGTVAGLALETTADWTLPTSVRFAPLTLRLPLGSTAVAAVAGLLAREDAPSTAHLLADEIGCDALAAWIAAREPLADACDGTCIRQVCEASFGAVTAGLETRLRALDARRPAIEVEGMGTLEGDAGDLERLGVERLDGTWVTAADERFDGVTAALIASGVP